MFNVNTFNGSLVMKKINKLDPQEIMYLYSLIHYFKCNETRIDTFENLAWNVKFQMKKLSFDMVALAALKYVYPEIPHSEFEKFIEHMGFKFSVSDLDSIVKRFERTEISKCGAHKLKSLF